MARGDSEEPKKQIPLGVAEAEVVQAMLAADDPATKEAAQLSQGLKIRDLKREAEEEEHRRSQQFKNHFELISIIVLWILFIGFMSLAAVWFIHLVLPPAPAKLHGWLSKDQIDKVQGVLTGGIIAGLVADHFKRRIG